MPMYRTRAMLASTLLFAFMAGCASEAGSVGEAVPSSAADSATGASGEASGPPETSPGAAGVPPTVAPSSDAAGPVSAAGDSPSDSPSPSAPAAPSASPVRTAEYDGPVEHLFFHPLVAFPELAFDGDAISQGYDDWFVTVPEFKRMLKELYERDYVLIRMNALYETKLENGLPVASAKKLMLPVGKKPLVLSVDDINYYDYMRDNGNAWRLVPDTDGRVTAWARTPEGEEKTDRNWELVPLVDDFVRDHPDFSWQGAKGLLALTGYEGVLGYRTNETEGAEYEADKAAALDIIDRLRRSGWQFASHSWGHLDVAKSSLAKLKRDTERWAREVEPLTGPTDIFVYPFGSRVEDDDPKFAYLRSQGFDVFCSVGPSPYEIFHNGTLQMDRRHIDGIALRTQAERLAPLFGDAPLLDPARDAASG